MKKNKKNLKIKKEKKKKKKITNRSGRHRYNVRRWIS